MSCVSEPKRAVYIRLNPKEIADPFVSGSDRIELPGHSEQNAAEVCSFTGYRPSKLPFPWDKSGYAYRRLHGLIREEITALAEKGVHYFQTGMARGIDLMCGEIVLELKKRYKIELICVIPCLDQSKGWGTEDLDAYDRLLREAAGVVQVTGRRYTKGCMLKRDRYLVDTAQYLISVFDGKKGGTMFTVHYAMRKKRTVIILDPIDYSRTELIHESKEGVLYV